MKYIVRTYDPMDARVFETIKDAKQFMINYAFTNNIDLGTLTIDKATLSYQITLENEPKIRFERNPLNFN
jgi:hypothetical protein